MNTRTLIYDAAASLFIILGAPFAAAQDDTTTSEVVKMNPFTVTAKGDAGYYASSTLAGTLINTQLSDLGSSVQVVTKQFMEDIGATDLDSLMQYTTNGQTAGEQGNFVGYTVPSAEQTNSSAARLNIGNTQSIRGLGNPDKTRDFFPTMIPFDNYNCDRVDIGRGANAFLFGLGSPAGVVNANLNPAIFQNRGQVSFRIGTGGNNPSTRTTLDINERLNQSLAIRVSSVLNDTEYYQRPSFNRDKRVYFTFTYKLSESTTVQGYYEHGINQANPPDTLLPQENLSMFLNGPNVARQSVDVVYNCQNYGNPRGVLNGVGAANSLMKFAPGEAYFFIWDGTSAGATEPTYARVNGVENTAAVQTGYAKYWNPNGTKRKPNVFYLMDGNYWEFMPTGYVERGFTNLDTFNFAKYNFGGSNDFVDRNFNNWNFSLKQLFLHGDAGFDLTFDGQQYHYSGYVPFEATSEMIFFDINKTLLMPDPNGNGLTPMANPNYGRPAIMTQSWIGTDVNNRYSQRFTGFIRHNFAKDWNNFWGRLLGQHQLTAVVSREYTDDKTVGYKFTSYTPPGTTDDLSTGAGGTDATQYDRQLFQLIYIGPQQLNAFTDPNFTLADFRIQPIAANFLGLPQGYSAPVSYWNVKTNGWGNTTVQGLWVPSNSESLLDETVTSYALASQSHVLDDYVVVNVGCRRDEVKEKLRTNDAPLIGGTPSVDPAVWNLNGTAETSVTRNICSVGGVVKWPRQLIKLPDWIDLSAHYNQSQNFQPVGALEDYLGNPLPTPNGVTKEWGFTVSLFNNKLVARVNWFDGALASTDSSNYWRLVNGLTNEMVNAYGYLNEEIIQIDANGDHQIDPGVGDFDERTNALLQETYDARDWLKAHLDPRVLALNKFQQAANGTFTSNSVGTTCTDLDDNSTKGWEIEIVGNPTPNWRIAANISHTKTALSNVAPRLSQFVDNLVQPYIKQYGNLVYGAPSMDIGQNTTDYLNSTQLYPFDADKAAEGTPSQEQPQWLGGVETNYDFNRGWLKGFSIGSALRWTGRYAYGYPTTTLNGIVIPVINEPYWSPTQESVDLWFGYQRKITAKLHWKIQLNMQNVNNWNSNKVTVIRVQPDGQPARARYDPPLNVFLTNTFAF